MEKVKGKVFDDPIIPCKHMDHEPSAVTVVLLDENADLIAKWHWTPMSEEGLQRLRSASPEEVTSEAISELNPDAYCSMRESD